MKLFRRTFLALILISVSANFVHAAGAAPERFPWSLRAPLPAANSETGIAELDGKIYVIGGYPWDRKTVATVLVYDSRSDKWQAAAPLAVPLNHVMPATAIGKIYVIGGQSSEQSEPEKAGFVNTVYEY